MVFNFDKIEDSGSTQIPPIFSVLITKMREQMEEMVTKNASDEISNLISYLKIFKSFLTKNNCYKSSKLLNLNVPNIGKKKDKLISNFLEQKLNLYYRSVMNNEYIVDTIIDYVVIIIMVYDNKISSHIFSNEKYIQILFSISYVLQYCTLEEDIYNLLYNVKLILEKIILKNFNQKKLHSLFCVINYPKFFHSKQLLNLLNNTFIPFHHQIKYMKHVVKQNDFRQILICASPVSSGKSVNTITSCYYQSIKNKKSSERKITLIFAPKLVVDEIARGCNANPNIKYWYYYNHKLVPSKNCCMLLKNNRHYFFDKPNYYQEYLRLKDETDEEKIPENLEYYIFREYNYYKNMRKKNINNNRMKKNLELPDVIFCNLDESNLSSFANDILFNTEIETIIIDEFLIPNHYKSIRNFFSRLIVFQNLKKLILISASAPSSVELFQKEYSHLYSAVKVKHKLEYIYENILPCFTRVHVKDNNNFTTWLPHHIFLTQLERGEKEISDFYNFINTLKWYHLRLYSPIIIGQMLNLCEKELGITLFELPNFNTYTEIKSNFLNFDDYVKNYDNKAPHSFIDLIFHFFMKLNDNMKNKDDLCVILKYSPKSFYVNEIDLNKKKQAQTWLYVNSSNFIQDKLNDNDFVNNKFNEMNEILRITNKNVDDLKNEAKIMQIKMNSELKDKKLKKKEKEMNIDVMELKEKSFLAQKELDSLNSNINNYIIAFGYLNNITINNFNMLTKVFKDFFDFSTRKIYVLIYFLLEGHILYIDDRRFEKYIQEHKIKINSININYEDVFGTDFDIYGIHIENCPDLVTLVQALGRIGRSRKYIEVPAIIDENSKKLLLL